MKNKGLVIVIISSIILVILTILFVFNLKNIDNNLLNVKWYHYNYNNGFFETLFINSEISYYVPTNDNYTDEYSFCNTYKYNKINKLLSFNCGKKIYIKSVSNDRLTTYVDNKKVVFFKDIENSKKYEFEEYFNMTREDYIKNKRQALEVIKIKKEKISDLLKEKRYSKIIFKGNNCKTVECDLIYDLSEKWISYSKDTYYINSSDIDSEKLNILFKKDINYNDIYPIVLILSDNRIVDYYKIKCSGFNCSMYYNK